MSDTGKINALFRDVHDMVLRTNAFLHQRGKRPVIDDEKPEFIVLRGGLHFLVYQLDWAEQEFGHLANNAFVADDKAVHSKCTVVRARVIEVRTALLPMLQRLDGIAGM